MTESETVLATATCLLTSSEYDALYDFYNYLGGHAWYWTNLPQKNSSIWNFSNSLSDPCSNNWYGLYCECISSSNHISIIQLPGFGLSGSIPTSISQFTYLRGIYLGLNSIAGTIPSNIGSLSNLMGISLHGNKISGTLPYSLQSLTKLVEISIYSNSIQGTIPSYFGSALTNLQYLYLHENNFHGTLPSSLGKLSHLVELWLYSNYLSGTLPSELGNLVNITKLYINHNNIHGTFPQELSSLQKLISIDFSVNLLTGNFPAFILTYPNMTSVSFGLNCFTGSLSSSICAYPMKHLQVAVLDGLGGNEDCPSNLAVNSELPSLVGGYLQNTYLSSSIPSCLWTLPRLTSLHVGANGFTGTLPDILPNSVLTQLTLSHNDLFGSIPLSFQYHSFITLDLSSNRLSGELVNDFTIAPTQRTLRLEDNRLSGNLPQTFLPAYPAMTNLAVLQGNHFSCVQSQLPALDAYSRLFTCGSNDLNTAVFSWLGFFGFLVLSVLYFFYLGIRTKSYEGSYPSILRPVINFIDRGSTLLIRSFDWWNELSSFKLNTSGRQADSVVLFVECIRISNTWATVCGGCILLFTLPINSILNTTPSTSSISFLLFTNGWVISSVYMRGFIPVAYISTILIGILSLLKIMCVRLERRATNFLNRDILKSSEDNENSKISFSNDFFLSFKSLLKEKQILKNNIHTNQSIDNKNSASNDFSKPSKGGEIPGINSSYRCSSTNYSNGTGGYSTSSLSMSTEENLTSITSISLAEEPPVKVKENEQSIFQNEFIPSKNHIQIPSITHDQEKTVTPLNTESSPKYSFTNSLSPVDMIKKFSSSIIWRKILHPFCLHLTNFTVTAIVNITYVISLIQYSNLTSTNYLFLQFLVGIFKLVWGNSFIPWATSQLDASSISALQQRYIMLVVSYIICPCFAVFVAKSSCFYFVFTPYPALLATFCDTFCNFILNPLSFQLECNSIQQVEFQANFTPPFSYSHECGSAVLTSYIPVLMYSYAISGMLLPVIRYSMVLSTTLRRIILPFNFLRDRYNRELMSLGDSRLTLDGKGTVVFIQLHLTVLLTFGLAYPLLGLAIVLMIYTDTAIWRLTVGKFLYMTDKIKRKKAAARPSRLSRRIGTQRKSDAVDFDNKNSITDDKRESEVLPKVFPEKKFANDDSWVENPDGNFIEMTSRTNRNISDDVTDISTPNSNSSQNNPMFDASFYSVDSIDDSSVTILVDTESNLRYSMVSDGLNMLDDSCKDAWCGITYNFTLLSIVVSTFWTFLFYDMIVESSESAAGVIVVVLFIVIFPFSLWIFPHVYPHISKIISVWTYNPRKLNDNNENIEIPSVNHSEICRVTAVTPSPSEVDRFTSVRFTRSVIDRINIPPIKSAL